MSHVVCHMSYLDAVKN